MRYRIAVALVTVLLVANPGRADATRPTGNVELTIGEASRDLLLKAAAIGSMSPIESPSLIIRLYAIQVPGACVPETHAVCAYHYLLITSSYDEAPVMKAYDLGIIGEITGMKLTGKEAEKRLTLELSLQSFPKSALKANRRLSARRKKSNLSVDENQVVLED